MTRRRDAKTAENLAVSIRNLRMSKFPNHGGQKAICEKIGGISPTVWSRWEKGKSIPDDVNQRKIAAFFGISLAELRGDHVEVSSDYAEHLRKIPNIPVDSYNERFMALEKGMFQNTESIEKLSESVNTLVAYFLEGSDRSRPATRKKRAPTTKSTKKTKGRGTK
jgi:transcriptional regulator with XRE-family HTH domain